MKRIAALILAVTVFSSLAVFCLVWAQDTGDEAKKQLIMDLVNEAAGLIEEKGQDALAIIADIKGKFNTTDTYIFITSGETGADLLNPAFQEIEGLPAENYTDPETKAAQMAIVDAVKDKDTAWVEYMWPKPNETKHSKKIAFLKKIFINGKERIIGAGYYPKE